MKGDMIAIGMLPKSQKKLASNILIICYEIIKYRLYMRIWMMVPKINIIKILAL